MIELRWLKKVIPTRVEVSPGSYGGAMMDSTKVIRVLQYRQRVETEALFDWTEWVNVPEVDDD